MFQIKEDELKKSNIIIVLLVFVFLSFWLFLGKDLKNENVVIETKNTRNLPNVVVEEINAVKKDISLEYFGKVYLGNYYTFESQYSDKVELFVNKGDKINKGDALFSYQNKTLLSKKQALLAEKSRLNVERKALESLQTKNFSSEIEYKIILENIAKLNANLTSTNEEINRSKKEAPENGFVEDIYIDNNQYVDNGSLIMDFQASENKVVSKIDVLDIPKINLKGKVEFFSNDKEFNGEIEFIGSSINSDNSGDVVFNIKQPLNLPNGYPGRILIHVDEKEVFVIPIDAALLRNDILGVYYIGINGKAVFQPIEIYKTQKNNLIVKSFGSKITLVTLGQYLIDVTGDVNVVEKL